MDKLFALDEETQEVIVSESPKGSNQINFVERIGKDRNLILYNAVVTLNSIAKDTNFDEGIFKAVDKICQKIYLKFSENKA